MKTLSNRQKILRYLMDGRSHHANTLDNLFGRKFATRISELIALGHNIEKTQDKRNYRTKWYRLVKLADGNT